MKINVENRHKVQSPYLYLQTAGSDGSDGSAEGIHLRWDLQRELGENHLPRGNEPVGTAKFNRSDDFVRVYRGVYTKQPTIISFTFMVPDSVDDSQRIWVFTQTNTGRIVYLQFNDAGKYQAARSQHDPKTATRDFLQVYADGLIEVWVKDELCFKANFQFEGDANTLKLRTEAVSVAENVPIPDEFVSCRRSFGGDTVCNKDSILDNHSEEPNIYLSRNLLVNGDFEEGNTGFYSDYRHGRRGGGRYSITEDAGINNPGHWKGKAQSGEKFMVVDVSTNRNIRIAWGQEVEVQPNFDYVFSGWISSVDYRRPTKLKILVKGEDGNEQFINVTAPSTQNVWEQFEVNWNAGTNKKVKLEIIPIPVGGIGEDFGIDNLEFRLRQELIEDLDGKCQGPNFLENPFFEDDNNGFYTDYGRRSSARPGYYDIIQDAQRYHRPWRGKAFHKDHFMVIDGASQANKIVWKQEVEIDAEKEYCFYGWAKSVYGGSPAAIIAQVTGKSSNVRFTTSFQLPSNTSLWVPFVVEWGSGQKETVQIEIFATTLHGGGNDFGLDALHFREKRPEGSRCKSSIRSEIVGSFRFDLKDARLKIIELETYKDFLIENDWDKLGDFALSQNTQLVESRLENTQLFQVNDQWQKFNGDARVNVANYEDRWNRSGGIKQGVTEYLQTSQHDPLAMQTLQGANSIDGSFEASLLNILQLTSLDYHVARMLGIGHIDAKINLKDVPYVHLIEYITEDDLELEGSGRLQHFYMSVPTTFTDYRLPPVPQLNPVDYGLNMQQGALGGEPLTDPNGYSPEQTSRYINLYVDQLEETLELLPFFASDEEFCATDHTNPVFFGVEYRKQGSVWVDPELSHDPSYFDTQTPAIPETIPLSNHGEEDKPIFTHRETEEGFHEYATYAINWFSRSSDLGNIVATDETKFVKPNTLIPPSNFRVQLIQKESPLLLTTQLEQDRLDNLPGPDKTLIRVSFDYHHLHDRNYGFGDWVELFFRTAAPQVAQGKAKSVIDDPSDSMLSIVRTTSYVQGSTGNTITPTIPAASFPNFAGGVLQVDQESFIIKEVNNSNIQGEGPIFTVWKNSEGVPVAPDPNGQFITVTDTIEPGADVIFIAVENLADANSWGTSNPLSTNVQIGGGTFTTHSETIVEDGESTDLELRGFVTSSQVTDVPDQQGQMIGAYRIDTTMNLPQHPQSNNPDPVTWEKGIVRIKRANDQTGPPKVLDVIKTENIGTNSNLIVYAADPNFDPSDPIQTGNSISVNYYPGYKIYLHVDSSHGLTESNILPAQGEGSRKTFMSSRSLDSTEQYESNLGMPAILFAQEFIDPLPPELPTGGTYATPPDFFYKSTFTFNTQFQHKPFAAAFYRASENAILNALYSKTTVETIRTELKNLGEDDPYKADRWKNLVGFHYQYSSPSDPYHDPSGNNPDNAFRKFPRDTGYRFPKPDKTPIFDGSKEPGQILDEVKRAVYKSFTPISKLPLMYEYIEGGNYQPTNKPQKVRNAQGHVLDPSDPAFCQAPMAKKIGTNKVQFTDFTLDGTSSNHYFYAVREIGNRNKIGTPSPILGPVFLINARPIEAPQVRGLTLTTARFGQGPSVELEVNGYSEEFKVSGFNLYRSNDPVKSLSIRTMDLVKTIEINQDHLFDGFNYKLIDDFSDGPAPFGDPISYRLEALRKVKDEAGNDQWAPSLPSKTIMTTMVDTANPEAPEVEVVATLSTGTPPELQNVELKWSKTTYNGTYYLEKQNAKGNWRTIYEIRSNQDDFSVGLAATSVGVNNLPKENDEGNTIYHRFRVRVMNSSGLFNLTEREETV